MSGKSSRAKGVRGQGEFSNMLRDRDWMCDQLTSGLSTGDLIGTDPTGKTWLVEVKNCAGILPAHKKQAIEQGRDRRLPWMLASKIADSSSWLIQRQGDVPCVWHSKKEDK